MKILLLATLIAPLSLALTGCGNTPTPTVTSINLYTEYGNAGFKAYNPNQRVTGNDTNPTCTVGTSGCVNVFDTTTNSNGYAVVATTDLPSYWTLTRYPNANCSQLFTYPTGYLLSGSQNLLCDSSFIQTISTQPSAIILGSGKYPTSIQIISTTPLLPTTTSSAITVDSYNVNAKLETQVVSTSQSGGGTILTLPLNPALLTVGSHILAIQSPSNPNTYLGTALLLVYSGGNGQPLDPCTARRVKCVALP